LITHAPLYVRTARAAAALGRVLACLMIVVAALAPGRAAADENAETAPACAGRDLSTVETLRPHEFAAAALARRDVLTNAQGLLWRIERPNVAPSYLFGTIHSTDARAVEIARNAATFEHGAKVVATELGSLDATARAEMGAAMAIKALSVDDDTFSSIQAASDRAAIEKYVQARGLPAAQAHHFRLWFLALLTGVPQCEERRQALNMPEVDQIIAETGVREGARVVGIETVEEQMAVLASMDTKLSAQILLSSARLPAFDDDMYATMLDLYALKQPARAYPVLDALDVLTADERKAQDDFANLLLGGRNETMTSRIAPLLADGGAFIAVGALHLVGDGGIIERLRRAGWSVAKVW
jgi:uncharacterized protein YbaP (TraB family)